MTFTHKIIDQTQEPVYQGSYNDCITFLNRLQKKWGYIKKQDTWEHPEGLAVLRLVKND